METTQIVWAYYLDITKITPLLFKQRSMIYPSPSYWWSVDDSCYSNPKFSGGVYAWTEFPNIRDVSMNCAKLGHNSDSDFGNTGYSLRSYLIKHGFITPAK